MRKPILMTAIGAVLLFLGVAESKPRFMPPLNAGAPINTVWMERDPYITADGQKLFFVSDRQEPHTNTDVYMSTWNGTTWSEPVNLGPNVNNINLDEWSPSVSPDGKKLYFLAFGRPGSQGGWDVWISDFDTVLQQWGLAQNLGAVINTFGAEWSPEISRDGLSLYYATNGLGHGCGQALYVARWNGSSWDTPQPLPFIIHETCTEARPSLTADEKTMYFERWNYVQSIYVTEKDSSDSWSEPVLLDTIINTQYRTTDPSITPDGMKLYFSSTRPGGFLPDWWDIWVTDRTFLGDLNYDGQFTSSDVVLELNKVFLGESIPAYNELADVNCDNIFTASDVVLILNRTYLGSLFPCN